MPILPAASSLFQRVQFCTATDGVRIAYATVGEGLPIVKAGNWLNHLEYDWESPVWSHLLSALASRYRLIRYDARGTSSITHLERVSRPGRRVYVGSSEIPKVLGGYGVNIVSTSKGLMSGKTARKENMGGELLAQIY